VTYSAEDYADAHANPANTVCPHCGLAAPRDGAYCPHCGTHLQSGALHQYEAAHQATMASLTGSTATSSSGRGPSSMDARRRQKLIDSFGRTAGTSEPLEVAFATNDKVLAAAESAAARADEQLRHILATKFQSADGPDLAAAVKDARLIASRLGTSRASRADIDELMLAFAEWNEASAALSAARSERSRLLDRHRQSGIIDRD
jgi:hypothetical protein